MKGMLRVSFCWSFFSMLTLMLFLSGLALGQTSTSISGTVLDQSGAVVPGAVLTLTNKATGATRSATTDNSGAYVFPQVNPGLYAVKAEKPGFKTVVLEDVDVLVNTAKRLDMRFDVGAVTETVVVTGAATAINTVDATIGNAFNSVQVRDLPLSGRNVVGLLSLQPGVTPAIGGFANSQSASVNGGRFDQANVTLDGVDVNDQDQFGGDGGKKFMIKRFRDLLVEIQPMSMKDQLKRLEKEMDIWQGKYEQTDDMLLVGIRF